MSFLPVMHVMLQNLRDGENMKTLFLHNSTSHIFFDSLTSWCSFALSSSALVQATSRADIVWMWKESSDDKKNVKEEKRVVRRIFQHIECIASSSNLLLRLTLRSHVVVGTLTMSRWITDSSVEAGWIADGWERERWNVKNFCMSSCHDDAESLWCYFANLDMAEFHCTRNSLASNDRWCRRARPSHRHWERRNLTNTRPDKSCCRHISCSMLRPVALAWTSREFLEGTRLWWKISWLESLDE